MHVLYRKTRTQITTIPQLLDYINLNANRSSIKWLDVKPSVKDRLLQWVSSDVEVRHKKLYSQFKNVIGARANRVFQLDFYLPEYNLYIEWTGMSDSYYAEKRAALADSSLDIIWTRHFEDIKKLAK